MVTLSFLDSNSRAAALALMDGSGPILDAARELSQALRQAGIVAPVIGGISVVLHGHWRATRDIDLLVAPPLERVAPVLQELGYALDHEQREFHRDGLIIHLVRTEQAGPLSGEVIEIEGVVTVPLADLIAMKLRSGESNILRAQDLADVIGLIRRHGLTARFASQIAKELRPAYRRLVKAIQHERTT
jgi:hypothetical protein